MNERSIHQYREAERRLWQHYGLQPQEYFLSLNRPRVRVRMQEVGQGEPLLFVHGGPNAGTAWAPLVAGLQNFRCLLLDRPGCGLSDPVDYGAAEISVLAADLLESVRKALEIERLSLVVSSIGGAFAYYLAQAQPQRVDRIVQLGCPGLVEGMNIPPFMRLLSVPRLNRLIARMMPSNLDAVRNLCRQIGHGPAVEDGRISTAYLEWGRGLFAHTNTMQNELGLMEKVLTWRGVRPELTFGEHDLSQISQPTLYIWCEDDPFGGATVARLTAARTPDASLYLLPHSGHLPWLDAPQEVATLATEFLQAEAAPATNRSGQGVASIGQL